MKSLQLLFKNNMKKRKIFSISIVILSFLVVLVGSSAICGLKMNGNVYDRVYESTLSPDVLICYSGVNYSDDFIVELKKLDNVTDVDSIEELFTSIKNKDDKEISSLIGSDENFNVDVEDGEIYFSNYYNNTGQFNEGDTVEINIGDYSGEYKVAGFFEDPIFGSSIMKYNQLIISDAQYKEICESESITEANKKQLVYLRWDANVYDKEFPDSVGEALEDFSGRALSEYIYDKTYIRKAYTMLPNIISIVMILATLFIGFGSAFVLRYALKNSIEGDYKEIGILKSVGCYYKRIKTGYVAFYLFLLLLGGIAGYIVSRFLATFICNLYLNLNGIDGRQYVEGSISNIGLAILAAFLLICIVLIFFTLYPVKKITPVEAIGGIKRKKVRNAGSIIKPGFLPFTMRFLFKQWISRAKQYLSLIIVTALFGFLLCCVISLNTTFENKEQVYKLLGLPQNDIILISDDNERMDKLEKEIASEYEVMSYNSFQQSTLKIDKESAVVLVYSNIPDTLMLVSGNKPTNEDGIILGYSLAKTLDKKVGDSVSIEAVDGEKYIFNILGIYQTANNLGKEFYMLEEGYKKLNPDLTVTQKVVQVSEPENIAVIEKRYEDNEYNVRIINGRSSTDGLILTIQKSLNGMINAVLIISMLLSGVITLMLTLISVAKDDRELKIFRLIGFRLSSLRSQYIFRIIVSSLIGCAIAFVAYLFLADIMFNKIISLAGLSEIRISYDKWTFASVLAVFFVAGFIISSIATVHIRKYKYVNEA